jgi:hypothetical protein
MLLEEKDLWDVVAGESTKPSDGVGTTLWRKKQRKAFIMITLAVKDNEIFHIMSCETETEAWEKLVSLHKAERISNKLLLRNQFRELRMSEGERMAD